MANFAKESFLKDKQIRTIHNGIDLNIFKIIPSVKKNNKVFRVLAVSNVWHKSKGLLDIYKLREMLDKDIEIVIVGVSKKQLKILPVGIKGIIRTQNVMELVQLYNEANILINPTYADTFPTVNLESLACGTPVITYNTGGSPEAIDEYTGIVVPQGDVKALASAIISLKNNPLSSSNCRIRAELLFDKHKCFQQYIDLYEELIKK
jgi:glycosyltransferase involved in cell wall biosynthesis